MLCRGIQRYVLFLPGIQETFRIPAVQGLTTDRQPSRIPKYISGKASAIAHKTGTGDVLPDGRIIGVNDLGLVELPDGRYFAIAVFVSDAASTMQECEEFIALAAEAVYEYMAEERIKG